MEILFFLILGLGVGCFGTLVGIGGGLILIPVFSIFLSPSVFTNAAQIVGTSIFVVCTNALSGTLAYISQKRVYFPAAVPFALATLPGAFLGSYIADKFNNQSLNLYFGLFLLCIAMLMLWNCTHRPKKEIPFGNDFHFNRPLGIFCSFIVGFLSSIFGIGGGVIHVPLMIYILGFPVHLATATSHFVLAASSLMGVCSHAMLHHILWLPAICIGIGAGIGAQIGARISKHTKSRYILYALSGALFLLGIRLILLGTPG